MNWEIKKNERKQNTSMQQAVKSVILFFWVNFKFQWPLCPLWTDNVCLHHVKFHDNKYVSKQLPGIGPQLTNIRKELLLLIRTDIGIFLMQMIIPTVL